MLGGPGWERRHLYHDDGHGSADPLLAALDHATRANVVGLAPVQDPAGAFGVPAVGECRGPALPRAREGGCRSAVRAAVPSGVAAKGASAVGSLPGDHEL